MIQNRFMVPAEIMDTLGVQSNSGVSEAVLAFSFAVCSNPNADMIDKFKLKLGPPQPGYRFKPGECIVNSNQAEEFRQGKCTPKQFDGLKMVVLEVGVDKGKESYRVLYDSPVKGGNDLPWEQIEQWYLKIYVESNFELCEYPAI